MKEKNRYIKRSRWWLTVPAVYVLMILIILRLYVITGENWHIIGISVQPFDTAFQLEVTSSNPQLDIASLTDGLKLKQEKMQKEGENIDLQQSLWQIRFIKTVCQEEYQHGKWESSFFICMKNGLRWRRLRFVSSLAETY